MFADDQPIPILRQDFDMQPNGEYNYAYETGNGIAAAEQGDLRNVEDQDVIVARGEYSYTDPDGNLVKVSYISDENGFQPQGDHLPVAPEIPPQIQRALAYLATASPPEDNRKK